MTQATPRRYGVWAGSPGDPEDLTRCIEVIDVRAGWGRSHQCRLKRGHGPEGLYCRQHDPAAVKAREAQATARWEAKNRAYMATCRRPGHAVFDEMLEVLEGAPGFSGDSETVFKDAYLTWLSRAWDAVAKVREAAR